MNPSLIPVAGDTAARFNRIKDLDNLGSDTLVALALDAYELLEELTRHAPELSKYRDTYLACLAGSHYTEVA